ncbi:hypothetical protein DCO57_03510 [Labrenzia sp. 011]|nr:hypothetical protein DCO57_03510 [Labrenzia sp. 011]
MSLEQGIAGLNRPVIRKLIVSIYRNIPHSAEGGLLWATDPCMKMEWQERDLHFPHGRAGYGAVRPNHSIFNHESATRDRR